MAGTFHCSFMMIDIKPVVSHGGVNETVDHPVGLGLFSTSVYDMDTNLLGCVSYYGTNDEFDGAFRAARTFGLMATLATSVVLICVLSVTLFVESRNQKVNLWSVARFLSFTAFLCQLLTFLAFGRDLCSRSDMECHAGPATVLTATDLFLLCFQSALIYAVPPIKSPLFLRRKDTSLVAGDDDPQNEANFEVLSKFSRSKKQIDDDIFGDLESDIGTETPSMIMEGIECVAADHLQRNKKSFWDELVDHYFAIGRKRSTR
jgi:hypothetical protein